MLGVGCNLGFEQDLESHVHAAVRVSVLIRIAVESGSNIEGLFQKVGHADTHVSDIRLKVSVFQSMQRGCHSLLPHQPLDESKQMDVGEY